MAVSSGAPSAARPRQFQFTLAALLAVMAWVGLICLALKQPTPFWTGAYFVLTVLALLFCVLVAIYRTGRTRAAAVGFLVFSVGYLACLALYAGSLDAALLGNRTPIGGAAGWLFDRLHPPIQVQAPAGPAGMGMGGYMGGSAGMPGGYDPYGGGYGRYIGDGGGTVMGPRAGAGGTFSYTTPSPFERASFDVICNLALAGLLGILGGIIAQWLHATRQEQRAIG
jgi:hypothetical protein